MTALIYVSEARVEAVSDLRVTSLSQIQSQGCREIRAPENGSQTVAPTSRLRVCLSAESLEYMIWSMAGGNHE